MGSWSQIKQNVPGFYGVGAALKKMDEEGQLPALKKMYRQSLFFKTLMDNCEMAMKKSFFPLTAYLSKHPDFGDIWNMIYREYETTMDYVLRLTGNSSLMANYPVEDLSIQMRERIVMPLTTIQQYALAKLRDSENRLTPESRQVLEKLVIRTSFGIINAVRNSA